MLRSRLTTQDGVNDIDPSKLVIMHDIGFFVCRQHQILDLAGPLGAFEAAVKIEAARIRLQDGFEPIEKSLKRLGLSILSECAGHF